MKNYATTEYNKLQVETEPGKRMKKGVIDEIIDQAKVKYNLPDHVTIKKDAWMDGT